MTLYIYHVDMLTSSVVMGRGQGHGLGTVRVHVQYFFSPGLFLSALMQSCHLLILTKELLMLVYVLTVLRIQMRTRTFGRPVSAKNR